MLPWFQAQTCTWMSIYMHFFSCLFCCLSSWDQWWICLFYIGQGHLRFCLREEKMLLSACDTCFQNGRHLFMLYFLIVILALPDILKLSQPGILCLCWSLIFPSPIITRRKNIYFFLFFLFSLHFLLTLSSVLQVVEGSLRLCRCRNI